MINYLFLAFLALSQLNVNCDIEKLETSYVYDAYNGEVIVNHQLEFIIHEKNELMAILIDNKYRQQFTTQTIVIMEGVGYYYATNTNCKVWLAKDLTYIIVERSQITQIYYNKNDKGETPVPLLNDKLNN